MLDKFPDLERKTILLYYSSICFGHPRANRNVNDEPIKANAVFRGVLARTSSGRIGARVAVAEDRGEPAGDERGRSRAERNSPPPGPLPCLKSRSTLVVAVVVASSSTQHSPTMSHMSGRRGREARREHGRQVARLPRCRGTSTPSRIDGRDYISMHDRRVHKLSLFGSTP